MRLLILLLGLLVLLSACRPVGEIAQAQATEPAPRFITRSQSDLSWAYILVVEDTVTGVCYGIYDGNANAAPLGAVRC